MAVQSVGSGSHRRCTIRGVPPYHPHVPSPTPHTSRIALFLQRFSLCLRDIPSQHMATPTPPTSHITNTAPMPVVLPLPPVLRHPQAICSYFAATLQGKVRFGAPTRRMLLSGLVLIDLSSGWRSATEPAYSLLSEPSAERQCALSHTVGESILE